MALEKVMRVFYGADNLPYKDKERSVHYPIIGSAFMGASNTTDIKFYIDRIGGIDLTWVSVAKLPNGKRGYKLLEKGYDSEEHEYFVILPLSSFYTQVKGDLYVSLNGYKGGIELNFDDEQDLYELEGTPIIKATGSVKLSINYSTLYQGGNEQETITLQELYSLFATKLDLISNEYIKVVENIALADISEDYVGKIYLSESDRKVYYKVNDLNEYSLYDFSNYYYQIDANTTFKELADLGHLVFFSYGSFDYLMASRFFTSAADGGIYFFSIVNLTNNEERWSTNTSTVYVADTTKITEIIADASSFKSNYLRANIIELNGGTFDAVQRNSLKIENAIVLYNGEYYRKVAQTSTTAIFINEKITNEDNSTYRTITQKQITCDYSGLTYTYSENSVIDLYSKSQQDTLLANKVDKTSNGNKVYGTDSGGNQKTFDVDNTVGADGNIVRRASGTSQIMVPLIPTANGHASSKKYVDGFGYTIELSVNRTTYVVTAILKDKNNNTLSTSTIDLPLESVVVSGAYDDANQKIVLTLESGSTIDIPVGDLVAGLVATGDITINGGYVASIKINNVNYPVAQNVTLYTTPKVVETTSDLPAENDGYLYLVLADGYLYYWDSAEEDWVQGYEYVQDVSNFVLKTTTIAGINLQNNISKDELKAALDISLVDNFNVNKGYNLKDELDNANLITATDKSRLLDKYVNSSGGISDEVGWCVYQFDVSGHNRIYCYMNNPVGVHYLYAFYEDDGTFISFVERSILISGGYIDIPNDAKYIKISFLYANIETFAMFFDNDIFYKLRYNFADKNDMIKYLNEKKINLVVSSTCIDNNYVNMNNGNMVADSSWSTTDYIQVVSGIRIYFDKGSSGSQVAFYSKDYVFISGALTNAKNSVVVPNNAMFMRWCFQTSVKSSAEAYFDTSFFSIRENIVKEVFPLIQGNTYNIIAPNDWEDGYYVRYNNGTLGADANYSSTGYIEVVPNVVYRFLNGAGGSQVAFYNESMQYISGAITGATGEAKAPENARYLRWCCNVSGKASAIVSVSPSPADTYEITTTIGLLQGIMNAYLLGYKKVLVKEGTYNLIDEYKAKYGATYFDDYASNYNGNANGLYDHGVYLENIEIKFELNSKVVCDYEGNNDNVKRYFSAFAVGINTIIDGLVLHARELRYGLHMDYNGVGLKETYIHIKNCDFDFIKETNNFQSLGCGLGIHSFWTIENCVFRTTEGVSGIAVRIHNNASSSSLSKIIVKDNYIIGDGYFKFAYYGASTKITDILVSNNSWITPASVGPETQDSSSENVNFNMLSWNNEERS